MACDDIWSFIYGTAHLFFFFKHTHKHKITHARTCTHTSAHPYIMRDFVRGCVTWSNNETEYIHARVVTESSRPVGQSISDLRTGPPVGRAVWQLSHMDACPASRAAMPSISCVRRTRSNYTYAAALSRTRLISFLYAAASTYVLRKSGEIVRALDSAVFLCYDMWYTTLIL